MLISLTTSFASNSPPLKNLSPLVVVIFAFIFLGERVESLHLWGIFLVLLGAYIIEANHHWSDLSYPFEKIKKSRHIHYVFFAILIWAFMAVGNKYLLDFLKPVSLLFYLLVFSTITTITAIHIFHNGFRDIKSGIKKYGGPIFLTSILAIVSDLALFQAMSLAFVSLVIPIKRLSTLFATVIGGEIFHEKDIVYY